MKHIEHMYLIVVGSVFAVGCIIGAITYSVFSEDCKTREELCSLDIKQIELLKIQLSKSESKCLELVSSSVLKVKKESKDLCDTKLQRIEAACNDLDCLQCRR